MAIDQVAENNQENQTDPVLEAVKLALDVTAEEYDSEITDLIAAAKLDMKASGVDVDTLGSDKLVLQAIKTYCRMNFQSPADYDRLAHSYEQQLTKLMHATGYTDYGEEAVDG